MYIILVSITALILILKLYMLINCTYIEEKYIFFPLPDSKYLPYQKYTDMFILCNNFYAKDKLMYLFYYFHLNKSQFFLLLHNYNFVRAQHFIDRNAHKICTVTCSTYFSQLQLFCVVIFYEGKIYTLGIFIAH